MLVLGKGSTSSVNLEGYSVDDNEVLYVINSDGTLKSIDNEGQETVISAPPEEALPKYAAILANFATNNPTVTTLINTFSEVPTWERLGTGQYGLTFLVGNPLVDGKTSVIVSAWNSAGRVYNAARYTGSSVIVESFDFSGVASDGISVIVEITIYP